MRRVLTKCTEFTKEFSPPPHAPGSHKVHGVHKGFLVHILMRRALTKCTEFTKDFSSTSSCAGALTKCTEITKDILTSSSCAGLLQSAWSSQGFLVLLLMRWALTKCTEFTKDFSSSSSCARFSQSARSSQRISRPHPHALGLSQSAQSSQRIFSPPPHAPGSYKVHRVHKGFLVLLLMRWVLTKCTEFTKDFSSTSSCAGALTKCTEFTKDFSSTSSCAGALTKCTEFTKDFSPPTHALGSHRVHRVHKGFLTHRSLYEENSDVHSAKSQQSAIRNQKSALSQIRPYHPRHRLMLLHQA